MCRNRPHHGEFIMNRSIVLLASLPALLSACGGSFPPPTQRMADAQSAERSARELGADSEPRAQLSLKLAQDQISAAEKAITDGDNERADSLLIRAKADAELAVAQARLKDSKVEGQKAVEESAEQKNMNTVQGAVK
jgi:hypothetical protein